MRELEALALSAVIVAAIYYLWWPLLVVVGSLAAAIFLPALIMDFLGL